MDSIIDKFFPQGIFQDAFVERIKRNRDGHFELIPKRSYGEGTGLLKPVGKSLLASASNITYRQSIEHITKNLPEYFHINLWQGTIQGIGGAHVRNASSRYIPARFSHRSVAVSFLPEFFETFLGSRYGISPDEIAQAIEALGKFPLLPDAAVILRSRA